MNTTTKQASQQGGRDQGDFMKNTTFKSIYFFGNEVSEYGKEHKKVDYRTLAKSFDAVLNNNIISNTIEIGYWETVNGSEFYYEDSNGNIYSQEDQEEKIEELEELIEELKDIEGSEEKIEELENEIEILKDEHYNEIFQYFIIDDQGANILQEYTDEILFYNVTLDMYVWGVTHWGTSWDYVLTNITLDI